MNEKAIETAKRRAGERAATAVNDGDVVGLGTGSTATIAIQELGQRIDGGLDIRGIPTSIQSATVARKVGIPIVSLDDATPTIAIDGADQVAGCTLLKGGGAAHAREKVVASAADRLVVVVDKSKLADQLSLPVPLEILESAIQPIINAVAELGGEAVVRKADRKDGPIVTDNGNLVLDADFGTIEDPKELATDLDGLPGLVAHGLFPDHSDTIVVGTADGVNERHC